MTDWPRLIIEHVKCKTCLADYVNGTSERKPGCDMAGQVDQCSLGKWIYGAGKSYEQIPDYVYLRTAHEYLHAYSAKIIELCDAGSHAEARKMLNGEYARLSQKIKQKLIDLSLTAING